MVDTTKDYIGIRNTWNGQSLGELEAQILDIVWEIEEPFTVGQIFKIMYPNRGLAYSTIMHTFKRMNRKGLLEQVGKPKRKTETFWYKTTIKREEMALILFESISTQILHKSFKEFMNSEE